jgi:ketosteroid isomerase-like protein
MTGLIRKHALLACLLWATACGGAPSADAAGEEMLAADRAFASATAERGIEGWLEYFADDGAVYRADEIARGRDAIRRVTGPLLADTTVRLVWEPDEAVAAPDGRFGYTSGPYRLVRLADDSMLGHGRYLTVWRRTPEGWKVVADIGAAAE